MVTRILEAVLWDMDGTLIDSEPRWIRSQERLSIEFGASWTYQDGVAYIGSAMEVTVAAMRESGINLPAVQIGNRLTEEVTESLRVDVPWRPGATTLVRALMAERIPQAIVTSSPRSMATVIIDALPPGAITAIISSNDVENRKPHPEPYLTAARALGVEPQRCVAIEDTPTGLTSALAAGAAAIGVPNDSELTPSPLWTKIGSLREVGVADLDQIAARHVQELRSPYQGHGG